MQEILEGLYCMSFEEAKKKKKTYKNLLQIVTNKKNEFTATHILVYLVDFI